MEPERKVGRPKGTKNAARTPMEKEQLIKEYIESGMGYKAFAASKGIAHSLFFNWLQKYSEGGIEALYGRKKRSIQQAFSNNEQDRVSELEKEVLELRLLVKGLVNEVVDIKKQFGLTVHLNPEILLGEKEELRK